MKRMSTGHAHQLDRPCSGREVRLDHVQAVILAGGTGTRLKSVVNDRPKPMASIGGKPFLELQITQLKQYGITQFIFCVGYLHRHIQKYFRDGSRWGVNIEYSIEEEPLGTSGALKHAEKYIEEPFLVFNGDSYLDLDLCTLIRFHEKKRAMDRRYLGTIVLTTVPDVRDFGSVSVDENNRVLSFDEKSGNKHASNQISAGIYVLEHDFLTHIPTSMKVTLERETFPTIMKAGFHLFGYPVEGFFADIGTPLGYRHFQEYIKGMQP